MTVCTRQGRPGARKPQSTFSPDVRGKPSRGSRGPRAVESLHFHASHQPMKLQRSWRPEPLTSGSHV